MDLKFDPASGLPQSLAYLALASGVAMAKVQSWEQEVMAKEGKPAHYQSVVGLPASPNLSQANTQTSQPSQVPVQGLTMEDLREGSMNRPARELSMKPGIFEEMDDGGGGSRDISPASTQPYEHDLFTQERPNLNESLTSERERSSEDCDNGSVIFQNDDDRVSTISSLRRSSRLAQRDVPVVFVCEDAKSLYQQELQKVLQEQLDVMNSIESRETLRTLSSHLCKVWGVLTKTCATTKRVADPITLGLLRLIMTNALKLYEIDVMRGSLSTVPLVNMFVKYVLLKFMKDPSLMRVTGIAWISVKEILNLVFQQPSNVVILLGVQAHVLDMNTKFISTWFSDKVSQDARNLHFITFVTGEMAEFNLKIVNRVQQLQRMDELQLCC